MCRPTSGDDSEYAGIRTTRAGGVRPQFGGAPCRTKISSPRRSTPAAPRSSAKLARRAGPVKPCGPDADRLGPAASAPAATHRTGCRPQYHGGLRQLSDTVAGVTVVRGGLSLVMVGRAAELRRLQGMVDGLTEPRVVLINGEAGVGKSRLVREFVATLRDPLVLDAHAEPGPLGRPFHLLHEAIESRVGSWTEIPPSSPAATKHCACCSPRSRPACAQTRTGDVTIVGEQSLRAAVDLVRYLLAGEPGVLVAEDLHWADAESLLLVGRLATTPDLPLLIVGTFRPESPKAGCLPTCSSGWRVSGSSSTSNSRR